MFLKRVDRKRDEGKGRAGSAERKTAAKRVFADKGRTKLVITGKGVRERETTEMV